MYTAIIYYIGAGRKSTGDWCFQDGFITFRDIAELYLRASSNFNGRVLSIISDCSYSGCWVKDCMEFLDKQGVQPCGHRAREKGVLIKVFASCKSAEIPTEYQFSVSGTFNDKNTGKMGYKISRKQLKTQTTDYVDSSELRCNNKTICEPCTLQPGYTWRKLSLTERVYLVHDNEGGCQYVSQGGDNTKQNFLAQIETDSVDVTSMVMF